MMFRTAMAMLVHQRRSTLVATLVVAAATFLILFQMSVYLGFRADTTVIMDAFDADLWIAPRHQPSFDGYVSIDDRPFHLACSTAGIASSGRVIWEYAPWRLPKSGSLDCIQILGLDTNSSMVPELSVTITTAGSTVNEEALLSNVQAEGHVLVGRKSMRQLEVDRPGVKGCEINERRAEVVGFVEHVHLFSTYGLVVTSLENAASFLDLPERHVSYIACKLEDPTTLQRVKGELQSKLPEYEVLSTDEFRERTFRFWQTKTGVGPILLFPCFLAAIAGVVVLTASFHILTIQRLPLMAALKAMGASSLELIAMFVLQGGVISLMGCAAAIAGTLPLKPLLDATNISIVLPPQLVGWTAAAVLATSIGCTALAAWRVFDAEPASAMRGLE